MSNYLYIQEEFTEHEQSVLSFVESLKVYAKNKKTHVYIIKKPLIDQKEDYPYTDAFVVLLQDHKILFVNFGTEEEKEDFDDYVRDFLEDLGSISRDFSYQKVIDRPRKWKDELVKEINISQFSTIEGLINEIELANEYKRKANLIISLLIGSINDIERVKSDKLATNPLERIKQKIVLFDTDQTKFIYKPIKKDKIIIQGLSGTGKTELLLHKLRELYLNDSKSRIMFTCFNEILADSLRKRVPEFFDFMQVKEQIKWEERLWVTRGWGNRNNKNSGAYRLITSHYGLNFYSYSKYTTFKDICQKAIEELKQIPPEDFEPIFDYMLIDESQDFPDSFFELCKMVTKEQVFIAGDIFQNIFDEKIMGEIKPDFLLNKCYRTDPRTLMFAHSLGMGLFENKKINWLKDEEWKVCGYIVNKKENSTIYNLTREPIQRFKELEESGINSMTLDIMDDFTIEKIENRIFEIIKDLTTTYQASADDIAIIFVDGGNSIYEFAGRLAVTLPATLNMNVNKAYETKEKVENQIFLSNKNNVKGLEFPFVICVSAGLNTNPKYRNALYMMLTRSFMRSYLLLPNKDDKNLEAVKGGLNQINEHNYIEVKKPTPDELLEIEKNRTSINYKVQNISHWGFVGLIFDSLKIDSKYRKDLYYIVQTMIPDSFDEDELKDIIKFNYKKMVKCQ